MKTRDILEKRLSALQEERNRWKLEASDAADAVLKEANRVIEKAVRDIRESKADKDITAEARKSVEQASQQIETQRAKVRKRAVRPKKELAELGPLQVGDQVRLKDGTATGELVSVDGKSAVVAFGSVQAKAKIRDVIKVSGPVARTFRVRQSGPSTDRLSVQGVERRIDLRGQRVDESLSRIEPFLDRAVAANVNRVEILHGKGTGALRQAIHEYLATYPGIARYDEAPIHEGGAGVTIVEFEP